MKVKAFIKKYKIKELEMRIFDTELEDEIYRPEEMKGYHGCEVVDAYMHNGDAVLQVASIRG